MEKEIAKPGNQVYPFLASDVQICFWLLNIRQTIVVMGLFDNFVKNFQLLVKY